MDLSNLVITPIEGKIAFDLMLEELAYEDILGVDTETVGKESLAHYEAVEPLKAKLRQEAEIFYAKFPKGVDGVRPKGYKTSFAKGIEKVQKAIRAEFKAAQKSLSGLHYWENFLGCVQVGFEREGLTYVYNIRPSCVNKASWERLGEVLNSRKELYLANSVFDITMLYHHTGILLDGRRIFDTQIAEWALVNGLNLHIGLKAATKRRLGIDLSKDKRVRISNWLGKWTSAQLKYGSIDVAILFPLVRAQKREIFKWGLSRATRLRMDFTTVCALMNMSGIPIDLEGLAEYKAELLKKLKFLDFDLRMQLEVDEDTNLNSPAQVWEALTNLGLLVEDTNEKTLKTAYPDHPVIEALLDYREVKKLLGNIEAAETYSRDGRLYATFNITGTTTGRLASGNDPRFKDKDPWVFNGQNVTKGRFRSYIKPKKGWKMIVGDYSQIQLRIAAQMANDEVMLEAYRTGQDLHTLTAMRVNNYEEETWAKLKKEVAKGLRQKGKAVNFGIIFGAGWKTVKNYALVAYGVKLTDLEAQDWHKGWKDTYQGVSGWHRWHPRNVAGYRKVNEEGREEWVPGACLTRTGSGLLRHFPKPEESYTDTLNTPVQGTEGDGYINYKNKWFYELLDQGYEPFKDFRMPTDVHDETMVEVREGLEDWMLAYTKEKMIEGMAEFVTAVPVEVDINIVKSWADKE